VAVTKKKRKQRKPAFRTSNPNRDPRFARLKALACFDQIKPMLLAGHSCPKVAEWIQEEQKELEDASREGIVTLLRRYRESFSDAELIQERMPQVFEEAKTRVHESLDELAELEDLYRLQKERVMIDVALERKFSKLLPSNTQEIRAAREILSTIAELKMDLGLHDRKLGTVDVDAKIEATLIAKHGDSRLAKTLANPQQRQRLLGIAKLMAKRAGREDEPVEVIDVPGEATDIQASPEESPVVVDVSASNETEEEETPPSDVSSSGYPGAEGVSP
jgi:hypothetical protein